MQNNLKKLTELGQSIWLDNLKRSFITSGKFERLIDEYCVTGVTSNPAIFAKAIASDTDYDAALKTIPIDLNTKQIFEKLAVEDIQNTCDIFSKVYKNTNGHNGYVSFEVSPHLAYDKKNTVKEAMRLWKKIDRPNLMIKVPATKQGVEAAYELLSQAININSTLLFGIDRYKQTAEAYLDALTERINKNMDVSGIASVASFFVSRVDTKTDTALENFAKNTTGENAVKAFDLRGQIAIANSKLAYKIYQEIFESDDFKNLAKFKAKKQRLLWASTSTKNPNYKDTLYVDELIGKDTINTMPDETLQAFARHGTVRETITSGTQNARNQINTLKPLNIDLDLITKELEMEGVKKFADSSDELLKTIERKISAIKIKK